jgi:predicted 2-oxoglutarate/Fe(II)-dependent dioxygenase YbiX
LAAVRQHWPEILKALELRKFLIYSYNMGCIAYENGGFFKRHIDHSPFAFCPRRLTWIYYFFKEPKGFDGGDLIFYGREKEEISITPYSGLLVAFGPHMEHEATTVTVTNSDFKSSRFSFTSFVAGYPSLQSAVSSTLYQIDARYPSTQVVTRPLITTARRIVRAQKRAKGTDVHQ